MSLGLQDALVALTAAGALAWLIRRRLRRGAGAACEGCPAAERAEPAADFVSLEELRSAGPGRPKR